MGTDLYIFISFAETSSTNRDRDRSSAKKFDKKSKLKFL